VKRDMPEKLDGSRRDEYPPLKIYLGELEEIEKLLTQDGAVIEILTTEYKYTSIQELTDDLSKKHLQTVKSLRIKTNTNFKTYVNLEMYESVASLYVSPTDRGGAGIFYKLDDILRRCRIPLHKFYNHKFRYLLAIVGIIVGYGSFLLSQNLLPYVFIIWSASVGTLIWFAWSGYIVSKRHSIIALVHKHSEKNFWQRNKDALLVSIISAIIGFILGIAATLISLYLTKKLML